MIRKAKVKDLDGVLEIVRNAVAFMQNDGNVQWNSDYPVYDDFLKDIEKGELFVDVENDNVQSVICLNRIQPEEYAGVAWKVDRPALVIHRMAVDACCHGRGLAKKLFLFAEERAAELKLDYIRSDTSSRNVAMNGLFTKMGYDFTGTLNFPGDDNEYNCYEKLL